MLCESCCAPGAAVAAAARGWGSRVAPRCSGTTFAPAWSDIMQQRSFAFHGAGPGAVEVQLWCRAPPEAQAGKTLTWQLDGGSAPQRICQQQGGGAAPPAATTAAGSDQRAAAAAPAAGGPPAAAAEDPDLIGLDIWPASIALCRYLAHHPGLVAGQLVLELGAGAPAVAAASLLGAQGGVPAAAAQGHMEGCTGGVGASAAPQHARRMDSSSGRPALNRCPPLRCRPPLQAWAWSACCARSWGRSTCCSQIMSPKCWTACSRMQP